MLGLLLRAFASIILSYILFLAISFMLEFAAGAPCFDNPHGTCGSVPMAIIVTVLVSSTTFWSLIFFAVKPVLRKNDPMLHGWNNILISFLLGLLLTSLATLPLCLVIIYH
jgi:uncharacterized membrane protein YwzB